jgi:hypothetical protein
MQFKAFAKTHTPARARQSRVRERSGLDSEDGNGRGRAVWRRVVGVFDPPDGSGGRIYQLGGSQPDNGNYRRLKHYCLCIQRVIVNARRCMAAAMRRWHLHLAALVLHYPAAGAFFGIHLRIRNHASHCGRQAQHQQEQHTELAEHMHRLDQTTSFRLACATIGGFVALPPFTVAECHVRNAGRGEERAAAVEA